MNTIVLPELGEGITQATVACWHVGQGALVQKDEDVVEVVTDKASFNIPSPMTGIVTEICVEAGQNVLVGSVLARIGSA